MGVEHFLGRLGALVLGLVGVMIGLVVNILGSTIGRINDVATHGGWGLLLLFVAFIASLLAPFTGAVAAVLFVIAIIGFFVVLHFGAIIPAIFWVIAAFLAYMDRRGQYPTPTRP